MRLQRSLRTFNIVMPNKVTDLLASSYKQHELQLVDLSSCDVFIVQCSRELIGGDVKAFHNIYSSKDS